MQSATGSPAATSRSHRTDALAKATGATRYAADFEAEGQLHAALARSPLPHARILAIDTTEAASLPGVVGIYTAADLPPVTCGRRVRDMPLLASERVRFVGERVAVVVAESRRAAERAAAAVEVDYAELPGVYEAADALEPGATAVHDEPWRFPGAVVRAGQHPNLQSEVIEGSAEETARALAASPWVVDRTYTTPADKQGYLEPQAWLAVPTGDGKVRLRGTTKSPYRLRDQIATCLGLEAGEMEVEPTPLGGDFGGKGAPGDAPLCVCLARITGRPVRLVLRSSEDLTATDARHPSTIRVRIGCDADGRLTALEMDALFAGGAYAASKPIASVNLHGAVDGALGYRFGAFSIRSRIAYTTTVPKGHMRSPGAMEAVFAVESAVDELASEAGISSARLRESSLLADGDTDAYGHRWEEARGIPTLRAALACAPEVPVPEGWLPGAGVAVYCRPTSAAPTSLRLVSREDGGLVVEVPIPETGTGNHTVVREILASRLGVDPASIEVRQVATSELRYDQGVGGSRVTAGMTMAVEELARRWREAGGAGPVTTETGGGLPPPVLSYVAQVARVAVDPATGQIKLLELVSAVDVANIVNPRAHQLQIDGGAVMGIGAACLEDLLESEGQIWAGNLGELKLPSAEDLPVMRTVLVEGGRGFGESNVKSVGELTNVAVAAAIANGIADATGVRVRSLPLTAEKVWRALEVHQ